MTTNQIERVPDEELDQMIWKLERDGGMTPKMLSLMRELREVRRAKGDPVAYMTYKGYLLHAGDPKLAEYSEPMPLYIAPSVPVVPTNVADAIERLKQRLADCHRFNYCAEAVREVEDACRAAMQLPGNSEQLEPVSNRDELMTNSFTNEDLAGMAHGDSPQANAYRELLAFRRNSPATQNGWIPVSERMPPEGTPLLVCSGNGVVQRTVYGFDGENWLDWYEQYDPVKAEPDDLWQPLPSAQKEEITQALSKGMERYGNAMQKLAKKEVKGE